MFKFLWRRTAPGPVLISTGNPLFESRPRQHETSISDMGFFAVLWLVALVRWALFATYVFVLQILPALEMVTSGSFTIWVVRESLGFF